MHPLIKIFLTGLLISFIGSLPLGTSNVAATNIAVKEGITAAVLFSVGSVLIEMIYVRISLVAMDWIFRQYRLFRLLEWLTVLLLLALATSSFVAAIHMSGLGKALPVHHIAPFLLGIIISAANPLHIIFWFGWTTILLNKHVLLPQNTYYNFYTIGIGIGSMLGFTAFILGGTFLVTRLNDNQYILNWIIGGILLVTACIQLFRILNNRSLPNLRNKKVYEY